jgi:hypothetical protein
VTQSQNPAPGQPRSRIGEWMYRIFGPAQVDGALQGHSPEAREAWKKIAARKKKPQG